jgi:SET domain-containing protein
MVEDAACHRGLGAMINHREEPNAQIIYDNRRRRHFIVALRDIHHDEQIFVNYGYNPVQNLRNVNTSTKYVRN